METDDLDRRLSRWRALTEASQPPDDLARRAANRAILVPRLRRARRVTLLGMAATCALLALAVRVEGVALQRDLLTVACGSEQSQ